MREAERGRDLVFCFPLGDSANNTDKFDCDYPKSSACADMSGNIHLFIRHIIYGLMISNMLMQEEMTQVQQLAESILRRCNNITSPRDFRPSQGEDTALCDISDMCRFAIALITPRHMVDNAYLSAFLKAVELQRSGKGGDEVMMMGDVLSAVKASPELNPCLLSLGGMEATLTEAQSRLATCEESIDETLPDDDTPHALVALKLFASAFGESLKAQSFCAGAHIDKMAQGSDERLPGHFKTLLESAKA